jgi:hypothetical protein
MENTGYVLGERVREALAQGYNFSWGKLRPVDYLEITARARAPSSLPSMTCAATCPPCSAAGRTSTAGC